MWGKELDKTGSINMLRHRWIGELGYYYDKDLAEYNIRARAYDPTYGHFLSRDPLGLSAGWNLYRYANTQPTVLVDPGGKQVDYTYYSKQCICASYWNPCQKIYYCLLADLVCRNAGNSNWANCVRECLKVWDSGRGRLLDDGNTSIIGFLIGCLEHGALQGIDHAICFTKCAWNTSSY